MSQHFRRSYDLLTFWAFNSESQEYVLINGARNHNDVFELFLGQSIEQSSATVSDVILSKRLFKRCKRKVLMSEP